MIPVARYALARASPSPFSVLRCLGLGALAVAPCLTDFTANTLAIAWWEISTTANELALLASGMCWPFKHLAMSVEPERPSAPQLQPAYVIGENSRLRSVSRVCRARHSTEQKCKT